MEPLNLEHAGRASAPTPPREAASLILWHREQGELRVLMGRRSASHRFMPGCLVFPGGRVDRGDHEGAVAAGLHPGVAAAVDGHGSSGQLRVRSQAFAAAALRELEEETGMSLRTPDMSGVLLPDLSTLRYLGRAVTPGWSPIRFDARFFVAPAAAAHGTARDSAELEDVGWYPADVSDAAVAPITARVLSAFRDAMMLDAQGSWPPPACFTVGA